MADEKHDKFVLKERQRLQAREKELERREAQLRAASDAGEASRLEVEALRSQLHAAAEALRRREEELLAARRAAARAAEDRAAAAGAGEAEARRAEAEAEAREERRRAEEAARRAEEARAAAAEARATAEEMAGRLRAAEEASEEKEGVVAALRRGAAEEAAEVARARAEAEAARRAAAEMGEAMESLKKVLSLAFAKHLLLLQSLQRQKGEMESTRAALAQMEALRCRDVARLTSFQEQVALLEKGLEVKVQLEAQLGEMAKDNASKKSALQALEASCKATAAEVSELEAKLSELEAQLRQSDGECAQLQAQLSNASATNKQLSDLIASLEAKLTERMRWIESLETTGSVQRRRIDELYAQLLVVLQLGRRSHSGEGVADAALAASAEVEVALLQAQMAGVQKRLQLIIDERDTLLRDVQTSWRADASAGSAESGLGGSRGAASTGPSNGCTTSPDSEGNEKERQSSDVQQLREQLASAQDEANKLRSRAVAAEGQASELQRQLRERASELRGLAEKEGLPGGVEKKKGSKAAVKIAALQNELLTKTQQIEEMEVELSVLKQMVRGQRAENRTRDIQNAQLRRKARIDPGEVQSKSLKLPPIEAG
ncbi:hypothetical protein AB1Y20_011320 [Prymnesium parvum]|uniref:RING-type E3 ubiquitin transferase n=1 Tax=Prymnesium parvum TaxID=97485 RepID=A0AB34IMV7_PRYPA